MIERFPKLTPLYIEARLIPGIPSAPLRSPPSRVMSGRTDDSTRITSAPKVASHEVA